MIKNIITKSKDWIVTWTQTDEKVDYYCFLLSTCSMNSFVNNNSKYFMSHLSFDTQIINP